MASDLENKEDKGRHEMRVTARDAWASCRADLILSAFAAADCVADGLTRVVGQVLAARYRC